MKLIYRIRDFLKRVFYKLRASFINDVEKDLLVLRMDGGICSQMHFYLIGRLLKERGYNVKYDITWYESNGLDNSGIFVRNFDLLKLFPTIDFSIAGVKEINFCKQNYIINNIFDDVHRLSYLGVKPPCYMAGYYQEPANFYSTFFPKYFIADYTILDTANQNVFDEIRDSSNSVSVHIRRGDLANYNVAYGNPCTTEYFIKCINILLGENQDVKFFFFSDEPSWVEEEVVGKIPKGTKYKIVTINGSDKGYMDLLLMSACKHHIASKGTLGKYGYLLSKSSNQLFCCDDVGERKWEILNNVRFI